MKEIFKISKIEILNKIKTHHKHTVNSMLKILNQLT